MYAHDRKRSYDADEIQYNAVQGTAAGVGVESRNEFIGGRKSSGKTIALIVVTVVIRRRVPETPQRRPKFSNRDPCVGFKLLLKLYLKKKLGFQDFCCKIIRTPKEVIKNNCSKQYYNVKNTL